MIAGILAAFVLFLREGVETALFLFGTVEGSNRLVATTGAAVGLAAAVMLGYLFYRGASRLDLRRFFSWTSVLLLLFAGWLLACYCSANCRTDRHWVRNPRSVRTRRPSSCFPAP